MRTAAASCSLRFLEPGSDAPVISPLHVSGHLTDQRIDPRLRWRDTRRAQAIARLLKRKMTPYLGRPLSASTSSKHCLPSCSRLARLRAECDAMTTQKAVRQQCADSGSEDCWTTIRVLRERAQRVTSTACTNAHFLAIVVPILTTECLVRQAVTPTFSGLLGPGSTNDCQ